MVDHHALIFMFEVMAMEQIRLIVFIRMREVIGASDMSSTPGWPLSPD
jgi:hypothetical protein